MSGRILVTPRSITKDGHPALAKLEAAGYEWIPCEKGRQPGEDELLKLLPGCVGYFAGVEPIGARVLEAATGLKAITRNGVGVSSIDLDAAKRLGIRVLTTPGANARGVAELTLAHMLSLVRGLAFGDRALKAGGWDREKGIEVKDRQLGLIGCGAIGRIVAELAIAFGMRVRAYDLYPDLSFRPHGFEYAAMDEVLAASDVISFHCPPPAGGNALVDEAFLARLKPGVFLLNTARGELFDDDAVLAALDRGHIAGLGLDAHREEPPLDRRLIEHPRVLATAHVGGYTEESVDRAVTAAIENLLNALGA